VGCEIIQSGLFNRKGSLSRDRNPVCKIYSDCQKFFPIEGVKKITKN
jgi:hypothetical protein